MPVKSTKINIICSNEGSKAVIFRRGPSQWMRMFLWDTLNDSLTPGQWIHSKVPCYGINSDASLVLSFVQSYRRNQSPWVALSKPPWFTALAVWHIGDSWGGNCGFVTDNDIYICKGTKDIVFEGNLKKGMQWSSIEWGSYPDVPIPKDVEIVRVGKQLTYIRKSDISRFEVRYFTLAGKRKHAAFQLEGETSLEIKLPDDTHDLKMDLQGRILYTRLNGIIYRISRNGRELITEELFNLSGMNPEPIKAPDHAIKW